MRKAIVALVGLLTLTLPMLASADEERSSEERVEVAPQGVFALPGPIYDEKGRLLAAPLPEAVGDAGCEPWRPRRRGEP
jgi:hypothetical protein